MWSDLTEADLSGSLLKQTAFVDVSLRGAKGLGTCEFLGPSHIDRQTCQRSGPLPLAFLRGSGFSDWEIEVVGLYDQDLTGSQLNDILYRVATIRGTGAVQFYSCFISYSTKDQEFADHLHANLQNNGVRCWFAPHDIQAGKKIHEQIDVAIRHCNRLLLILSEHSMNSEWVKTEIAHARQKELNERRQVLFPISLVPFAQIRDWKCFDADTGKDSAREIREYFIPDFSNWKEHDAYQQAFQRLVRDLKAEANPK